MYSYGTMVDIFYDSVDIVTVAEVASDIDDVDTVDAAEFDAVDVTHGKSLLVINVAVVSAALI